MNFFCLHCTNFIALNQNSSTFPALRSGGRGTGGMVPCKWPASTFVQLHCCSCKCSMQACACASEDVHVHTLAGYLRGPAANLSLPTRGPRPTGCGPCLKRVSSIRICNKGGLCVCINAKHIEQIFKKERWQEAKLLKGH